MTTALLHLSPSRRSVSSRDRETDQGKPSGFTLVELLVAMCVSLLLLGGVVSLFGTLGESVNNSKSNSEMLQTMRHTARQLQSDLGNVSLVPDPAQTMVDPQGFFEYVEGPLDDTRPDLAAAAADPELPPSEFVDNQDAGYTEDKAPGVTQSIGLGSAGGSQNNAAYNNNTRRAYSKYLHGYGQWQKTGLESGTYRVSITWPTGWTSAWTEKHESNIPVTITAGDNTESFTVDQTQEPNDLDEDGTGWKHLGEIDVTDGEILVQIGPCGQGYAGGKFVFADAIRIECLELTGGGDEDPPEMSLTGDCDDVLHFTTKKDEGAYEVVWFLTPMKGHENKPAADKRYRLHRVIRAIRPSATTADDEASAIPIATLAKNEKTLRPKTDDPTTDDMGNPLMEKTPSSLQDLALRENRFAHEKRYEGDGTKIRDDSGKIDPNPDPDDGPDPEYADCFNVVTAKNYLETLIKDSRYMDDWDPNNLKEEIRETGDERLSRTVVLENVIAFDVRAYDPTATLGFQELTNTDDEGNETVTDTIPLEPGDPQYENAMSAGKTMQQGAFVDLGYAVNFTADNININSEFSGYGAGNVKQDADGNISTRAYDSWSGDYVKPGDVGFENGTDNIVDTAEDLRESPPYDAPLRAVQVEIRMQEPESGKVRSVKVRKFLGKR